MAIEYQRTTLSGDGSAAGLLLGGIGTKNNYNVGATVPPVTPVGAGGVGGQPLPGRKSKLGPQPAYKPPLREDFQPGTSKYVDDFMSQHKKSGMGKAYATNQQTMADIAYKKAMDAENDRYTTAFDQYEADWRAEQNGYANGGDYKLDPIYKKGASFDALEAKEAALQQESGAENARWKGKFKAASTSRPVEQRESPRQPMIKTIEGDSPIGALPKEASNVYGLGPGRRTQATGNLGQGNYRLF